MSIVKVRVLIGKEGDLVNCNGNLWEDRDEAGDIEPLNSDESFLPVEEASTPAMEAVS